MAARTRSRKTVSSPALTDRHIEAVAHAFNTTAIGLDNLAPLLSMTVKQLRAVAVANAFACGTSKEFASKMKVREKTMYDGMVRSEPITQEQLDAASRHLKLSLDANQKLARVLGLAPSPGPTQNAPAGVAEAAAPAAAQSLQRFGGASGSTASVFSGSVAGSAELGSFQEQYGQGGASTTGTDGGDGDVTLEAGGGTTQDARDSATVDLVQHGNNLVSSTSSLDGQGAPAPGTPLPGDQGAGAAGTIMVTAHTPAPAPSSAGGQSAGAAGALALDALSSLSPADLDGSASGIDDDGWGTDTTSSTNQSRGEEVNFESIMQRMTLTGRPGAAGDQPTTLMTDIRPGKNKGIMFTPAGGSGTRYMRPTVAERCAATPADAAASLLPGDVHNTCARISIDKVVSTTGRRNLFRYKQDGGSAGDDDDL
jgi:hypothetical protein